MIPKEYESFIDDLIELAIKEDIGDGDHSSLSTIPEDAIGRMKLLVKDSGIIAGLEIAERVFRRLDPSVELEFLLKDGDRVKFGDIAFYVSGRMRTLLQSERVVLNLMQRMSGVATQTDLYVGKLVGLNTKILDTRKTTPGMRVLEKMAVKIGGGENHRIGLFDMIMLKDNHVDMAGGVEQAVGKAVEYKNMTNRRELKIELECRTLDDVRKALEISGVDRIMLDNFSVDNTRKAVELVAGAKELESSGGITLDTLRDYAECGVDYISVGALTHQIKSLDMSLKVMK